MVQAAAPAAASSRLYVAIAVFAIVIIASVIWSFIVTAQAHVTKTITSYSTADHPCENGRMPSALPIADPAPADGLLPRRSPRAGRDRDFGVYLHVPFCRVRCGYCDFNTYTATELRGVKQSDYAGQALAEIALAARVLGATGAPAPPATTVFFGGGTPTLLPVGRPRAPARRRPARVGARPRRRGHHRGEPRLGR